MPRFTDPAYEIPYAWLAANGIAEWLPDDPVIHIDTTAGTLTYTAYQFTGPRGFNAENLFVDDTTSIVTTCRRTVALQQPPTASEIAAFAALGATVLVDQPAA